MQKKVLIWPTITIDYLWLQQVSASPNQFPCIKFELLSHCAQSGHNVDMEIQHLKPIKGAI